MSGKVKKIKVGEGFYILSASGSSRMADQVSEQTKRAAERAREEAKRQMNEGAKKQAAG